MRIKRVNEMSRYDEVMSIADFIFLLEEKDPKSIMVSAIRDPKKGFVFKVAKGVEKIDLKGKKIENINYNTKDITGYVYILDHYPQEYIHGFMDGFSDEVLLEEYTTAADLLSDLKQIEDENTPILIKEYGKREINWRTVNFQGIRAIADFNTDPRTLTDSDKNPLLPQGYPGLMLMSDTDQPFTLK